MTTNTFTRTRPFFRLLHHSFGLFKITALCLGSVLLTLGARSAVPAPEKLLPDDTLFLTTIPDMAKMRVVYKRSPESQFWNDPAMKPFREKFMNKLRDELLKPL